MQFWKKKTGKPTVGIIDLQSVKNNQKSDKKGFDAGKKVKGVKRHIVTDSNGFILSIDVHSAIVQDKIRSNECFAFCEGKISQHSKVFCGWRIFWKAAKPVFVRR